MPTYPMYMPNPDGSGTVYKITAILTADEYRAICDEQNRLAQSANDNVAVMNTVLTDINRISPPVLDIQPEPDPITIDPIMP